MGKREVPNTWISILRANYRTLQFIDLFLLQYHIYISELYQGVTAKGFRTKNQKEKKNTPKPHNKNRVSQELFYYLFFHTLDIYILERYFSGVSFFIFYFFFIKAQCFRLASHIDINTNPF